MSTTTIAQYRQARRAARNAPQASPLETFMASLGTATSQLAHFLAAPALGALAFMALVFAAGMSALLALVFAIAFAAPAGWFLGRL